MFKVLCIFLLALLFPASTPSPAPEAAPTPTVAIAIPVGGLTLGPLGPALVPGLIGAALGAGVTGAGVATVAKVAKTSLLGGVIGSRLLSTTTTTSKPSYGHSSHYHHRG